MLKGDRRSKYEKAPGVLSPELYTVFCHPALPKLVLPGAGSDTSEDDRLVESSDEMDGPVALRAVKWRPASRKEDRYVAPGNADLLRTIRRRDVNKVKMVLKVIIILELIQDGS